MSDIDKEIKQGADNTKGSESNTTADSTTSLSMPTQSSSPSQYANGLIDYINNLSAERAQLRRGQLDEDEQSRKRKLARDKMIASIGDGISALARIGAANGYAPVTNDNNVTALSDAYSKRYNDYIARRDKAKDAYDKAILNLNNRDYIARKALLDLAQKDRNIQSLIDRRNSQSANDNVKTNAYIKTQGTLQDLNEARKATEQGKPALQQSQIELNKKRGDAAITTANAASTRAAKAGSGGKGATAKYPVFDKNGSVVGHVYTRDEAVSETERNGGTYPKSETVSNTKSDITGQNKQTTSTKTYTAGRKKVIKGFGGHK